ncbi:glycosyltransferase family 4 protein [Corynebacterium bovis]|uniref:Phosphatidylinositol alpha-mannosyltransferase n=1 Tax=Corynebacterium bovis DSM 20582 = CIP 54.80 TaxID=927655 RepID=A0A8I0CPK1_9CORY|nr:glycosyltransferase family 4 protein [Corynebacterium bovis]MBB3116505.1 phosphatidylinositol alpha-mannosyltransferase [Corynebacterium bovis DSM 20582 = CIP 54.80]QQC47724.1 glycosyltransferase family 4 protein [Corynebacterium bovis]
MKIGMVCPYSFDEPGGVQAHAIQLCTELQRRGHEVSLIGPGTAAAEVPDFADLGGGSIPIPYNGSVARLSFGPPTWRHLRRWISGHDFDVVHLHEPNSPSYSMITLAVADGPLVATYHASASESLILRIFLPVLRPFLEKIHAGIAVSEEARRWQVEMLAGDPVLIPNGVDTRIYREASPLPGLDPDRPRVMFLGRFEEPRKGFHVLLAALPAIVRAVPDVEVLVAGSGDVEVLHRRLREAGVSWVDGLDRPDRPGDRATVRVLGRVSDADKARALAASDVYVAPNTGGESFGIVLVEAMAAGAAVVASDLPAFLAVTDHGDAGHLFGNGSGRELARRVIDLLEDDAGRAALVERSVARAATYDWDSVTTAVERVYETVVQPGRKVRRA